MPLLPLLDLLAASGPRSDAVRLTIGPVKGCLHLVGLLLRRKPKAGDLAFCRGRAAS